MKDQTTVYRLGSWNIYPASLLLKSQAGVFKVQDKVMQVLLVLIEANGEVVLKEVFNEKVWADAIVTENSLSKAISELRKIFDTSSDKDLIATVSKKGYRITATVYKEKIAKKGVREKSKNQNLRIVFYTALLFLLGLFVYHLFGYKEEMQASSLAPNGKTIAYYKKLNGQYVLQLEDIEEKEIKEIATDLDPESFIIDWSPDSRFLVYNATREKDLFYAINVISLENGTTTYIKFAKNEENHQTESTPEVLDSPAFSVDHREIRRGSDVIHHIYLTEKDTIKVYFQNSLIKSFSW